METSVGWIEIGFSNDQRFASLFRLDSSGWVVQESEWEDRDYDRDYDLATAIEGLGVPTGEAQAIAAQTEKDWLARGGIPQVPSPWWEWPAFAAILIATVGVWLTGVAFLIWLLMRLVR